MGERGNFSDPGALFAAADAILPRFAGGGGRYRLAKRAVHPPHLDGLVDVHSMHENTSMILGLLPQPEDLPTVDLAFDGQAGVHDRLKISSFLYYLENDQTV